MNEIWKDIKGFENQYQVSNFGKIKSLRNNMIMKQTLSADKYYKIKLSVNNKPHFYRVHRLVAQAFLTNDFNLPVVNHINGIKTDNRVENLEWCTIEYNNKHAVINELFDFKHENNPSCKLTKNDVDEIRLRKNSVRDMVKIYSISETQIYRILNNQSWK